MLLEAQTSFWMPKAASTMAERVDSLYYFILYLSTFFFVGIVGVMVYFAIKYKKKSDNDKTSGYSHDNKLEVFWSVIPTLLLVVIFWWGFKDWIAMQVPPDHAMEVRVTARQWSWQFDYPKDGITTDRLVVPANRPVRLIMSSSDVLHSFFIPEFRVKKDVLPNRYTELWFESPEPGIYNVWCAEYCGKDHSRMITRAEVKTPEEYQKWIDSGGGLDWENTPMSEIGKIFFKRFGCTQCHSDDGSGNTGPTMLGLFGKKEELATGETVLVDENYLRESIIYPGAKVVKGFAPKMPSFKGKIKDKQLNAIIEYIKSVGK